MRTAELIALAGTHGIDLAHVACNGAGTPRWHDDGCDAPGGRQQRRPRRGDPAVRFEQLPWLAARYSFANDSTCYWPLWNGLVFQALRLGRREHWPARVHGSQGALQFYLLELAQLVLDAEANQPLFVAAPRLYALSLRVEDSAWREQLEPRYRALRAVYERWLAIAREMIGRWITEGPRAP